MANQVHTKMRSMAYLLPTAEERILIWEKARGVWKQRKPDAIRELAKMRREWNRKPLMPR
jgi:hypothetical protein